MLTGVLVPAPAVALASPSSVTEEQAGLQLNSIPIVATAVAWVQVTVYVCDPDDALFTYPTHSDSVPLRFAAGEFGVTVIPEMEQVGTLPSLKAEAWMMIRSPVAFAVQDRAPEADAAEHPEPRLTYVNVWLVPLLLAGLPGPGNGKNCACKVRAPNRRARANLIESPSS